MLTHERLLEVLRYEPDTGLFYRKVSTTNNVKVGDIAGTSDNNGYIGISIDGSKYKAHRLAWFYTQGQWPSGIIDHINRIKFDNRIANLRDVADNVNSQNQGLPHKDSKTGFLGVTFGRGRYIAQIMINGKVKRLGGYRTPEEAHEAYLEAKRKYHPGNTL